MWFLFVGVQQEKTAEITHCIFFVIFLADVLLFAKSHSKL